MTRPLSLRELCSIAAQEFGAPVDEVADYGSKSRAKVALDAASAHARDANGVAALAPDLPAYVEELVAVLLARPPWPERAGRIAFQAVSVVAQRSGGCFGGDPLHAVLRFDQAAGDAGAAASAARWTRSQVTLLSARSPSAPRQDRLFGFGDPQIVVGIFLGGPVASLGRDERERIDELNRIAQSVTVEIGRAKGRDVTVRLVHPSFDMPPGTREIPDVELWEVTSTVILEEVDALILSDVARKPLGFGASSEIGLHGLQDGPAVLFRHRDTEPESRYLRPRAAEMGMEVIGYGRTARLSRMLKRWVNRNWSAIENAARRRDDRRFIYEPLQRQVAGRLRGLSARQRVLAADSAGLTTVGLTRAIASPIAFATLPAHRRDALCAAVGAAPGAALGATGTEERRPRYDEDAIWQIATDRCWAVADARRVRDEVKARAERERVGRARTGYTQPENILEVARELGVER